MSAHRPRLEGDTILGTRQTAGILIDRHPDQIRRRCKPIACDVTTHALLYDLDAVADLFRRVARRAA